ncbi:hypothetical protein NIES4072_61070 [Nostoc commune NIES-4072]|uniref:Uncharacterized protein n=1 Tax=Nostoc commune NIES-4072 TaxID=2005467 RepID=A0A2R5FWF5_NOSCO|nr:hypothetical protein [Nostoc commune]BBD66620.1 hypothetical protein NIES4070_29890 [Nostoc commune HK-02]GBG22399.1 hypothetical protein NIES4072_61070 [Nostoc commune NIES-4072]
MATITIQDINARSFISEVDANELNEIHGGGPIRDFLHDVVDAVSDFFGW